MRPPVTDSLLPTPFSWRQASMDKGFDSRLDQGWSGSARMTWSGAVLGRPGQVTLTF
jgi:hypothetical protein